MTPPPERSPDGTVDGLTVGDPTMYGVIVARGKRRTGERWWMARQDGVTTLLREGDAA